MPDLIAVEESGVYAAVVTMIEEQDPPLVVKKQIGGVSVYDEESPSALYLAMREGMFEAYRRAAAVAARRAEEVAAQGGEKNPCDK